MLIINLTQLKKYNAVKKLGKSEKSPLAVLWLPLHSIKQKR
jgi:hypothetical protein